jgi:ABC-type nitrate/sulfonate/bicarbonate transport system substrate-binding protein
VKVDLMDFSVLYQQLFKGAIDSAEAGLPGDEASFLTAEKQGQKLYLVPASDWGFLDYPKMLIARNEIIQSNPDLVRRLVRAIHHSLTDALANASDADMLAAAKVLDPQIDADAAKLGWDDVKKYESGEHGPLSADVFAEAIDLAKQSQNLTTTLKPEDLFTNEFVPAQ